MPLYRLVPERSRFTVQAFATGALSFFGHNPTFAVDAFKGTVRLDGPGVEGLGVDLTVRADSLELIDRVKAADREEIMSRMRRDVLETSAFPEIAFHTEEVAADPVDRGRFKGFLGGRLTLHGVTSPQGTDAELLVLPDGLRLRGECVLRMSAFRIKPVTALAGAIKLKDELKVTFDLTAVPETP
jgi:polyisoprenoid-binding protein YceI